MRAQRNKENSRYTEPRAPPRREQLTAAATVCSNMKTHKRPSGKQAGKEAAFLALTKSACPKSRERACRQQSGSVPMDTVSLKENFKLQLPAQLAVLLSSQLFTFLQNNTPKELQQQQEGQPSLIALAEISPQRCRGTQN